MNTTQLTPTALPTNAIITDRNNISLIMQDGPANYNRNVESLQKCTAAGQSLLREIEATGMTDDLDQRLAAYLEKTRKTIKAMNARRAPVTKLFDMVRAEFTTLENTIDPTRRDTIPWAIAQHRNNFAALKHRQEEERRRAELIERQHTATLNQYRADIRDDCRQSFSRHLDAAIDTLTNLNASLSLDNYDYTTRQISTFPIDLPHDWQPDTTTRQPLNITTDEASAIRHEVISSLRPGFEEQYRFDIEDYCRDLLDRLPSKLAELQRASQADAHTAATIMAKIARQEAAEAALKEQQRRQAEATAVAATQAQAATAEMSDLFAIAQTQETYTPKTKVSKKLIINDPAAILPIISLWWQREGSTLPVDDLTKMFKKQITFCEKLATKEELFVEAPGLEYIDDIKAR